MSRYILIDNEQLCFVKATPTLRQAEYWADILLKDRDFIITGDDNRCFSVYTHYELRLLFGTSMGITVPDDMEYAKILKGVADIARELILDETSEAELKLKLGRDLAPVDPRPVPEKPKRVVSGAQNKIPGRPAPGSTTGKVWAIADTMHSSDPGLGPDSKDFRKLVVEECVKDGINASTAATQFAKWRKHLHSV